MGKGNKLEFWEEIPSAFGFYSASNLGRIRRDKRFKFKGKPKILKSFYDKRTGYYQQRLSVFGKDITKRVHVLVAEAFIGTRPKGYQINHLDGNKKNNRASNLEYVTSSENALHAVSLGNWPDNRGSRK